MAMMTLWKVNGIINFLIDRRHVQTSSVLEKMLSLGSCNLKQEHFPEYFDGNWTGL